MSASHYKYIYTVFCILFCLLFSYIQCKDLFAQSTLQNKNDKKQSTKTWSTYWGTRKYQKTDPNDFLPSQHLPPNPQTYTWSVTPLIENEKNLEIPTFGYNATDKRLKYSSRTIKTGTVVFIHRIAKIGPFQYYGISESENFEKNQSIDTLMWISGEYLKAELKKDNPN